MHECQPDDFEFFDDYFDRVIEECWLKIIAEDSRVNRAVSLMLFQALDNDRSIEANLLASVAEEYKLDPDAMEKVLYFHDRKLVNNYE